MIIFAGKLNQENSHMPKCTLQLMEYLEANNKLVQRLNMKIKTYEESNLSHTTI